jgi:hypothetical protein
LICRCYMSGQTGAGRKQCKVAVFLFARKLPDPDPNAPATVTAGSLDTDKRAPLSARDGASVSSKSP